MPEMTDHDADRLVDAGAAIAEKNDTIERLRRQLGHAVDEWSRLEDEAETREVELRELEASHAAALERIQELERQLGGLRDRRMQACQSRDTQTRQLLLDVIALFELHDLNERREPERSKTWPAIAQAVSFLESDGTPRDKAARAFETVDLILHEHGAVVRAFGPAMRNWMTKEIDNADTRIGLLRKFPKALGQMRDSDKEYFHRAPCYRGELYVLREQMTLQEESASLATVSAIAALRCGADTRVVLGCIRTAFQAYAIMHAINSEAGQVDCDIEDALRRSTEALEAVIEGNARSGANPVFPWSSSGVAPARDVVAHGERWTAQDYVAPPDTACWENSSDQFGTYGYANDSHDWHTVNPANGLPMIGGDYSGVDVMGNPYGMDEF